MPTTSLFTPFSLRSVEFDNRIVVSPMSQYSADNRGHATAWHLMYLGHLAISGAGLVFLEATAITPCGRSTHHCLGLWNDAQAAALRPIVEFCRLHGGAKLGIQLQHAGRKGSIARPWDEGSEAEPGWPLAAPSATAYPGRPVPEQMDAAAMEQVISSFARAARRADEAGFDVIELHNAHGYLLHSFLSPHSNQRTDSYGGSLANRMRLPLRVFDAVRSAWPQDKPLGVRVSATDWTAEGWSLDDAIVFARELKARGCDYLCVSSGGSSPDQAIPVAPDYQVALAERIRQATEIPTMAVGLITDARQADAIVASGQADLVAIGRAMLNNPRWAAHAAQSLGEQVHVPPQYERGVNKAIQRMRSPQSANSLPRSVQ